MPEVVFSVDQSRSMRDQAVPGHNRWHPDIPPAVTVRPGQDIRVECKEWTDGQIGDNDSAKDNGGGFLTDYFPDAYKAIWDFRGQKCTSRHVLGVEYTGITHPGLFGT